MAPSSNFLMIRCSRNPREAMRQLGGETRLVICLLPRRYGADGQKHGCMEHKLFGYDVEFLVCSRFSLRRNITWVSDSVDAAAKKLLSTSQWRTHTRCVRCVRTPCENFNFVVYEIRKFRPTF